jgi:hypothetical protein
MMAGGLDLRVLPLAVSADLGHRGPQTGATAKVHAFFTASDGHL